MGPVETLPERRRCVRIRHNRWHNGIFSGTVHGQKTMDTTAEGGHLTYYWDDKCASVWMMKEKIVTRN